MTTVMCFGTFDVLHPGHRFYLQKAKEYGDVLIVVVARDETVEKVKKRKPQHNEQERLKHVQALPEVNTAVLGSLGDKFAIIKEHHPDILCLGYDQEAFTDQLQERVLANGLRLKILRIPSFNPDEFKSSKIKKTRDMRAKDETFI